MEPKVHYSTLGGRCLGQLPERLSMQQQQLINQHTFANGLTLVAQSMPWLQSAAFTMAFPSGCRFDPLTQLGLANFTCEMSFRCGGSYDNRGLVEKLEELGCDYYSNTGIYHTFFGGALPADGLFEAIRVYKDVLRAPHFPEAQLEDGRNTCLQEIQALEDDLAGKSMLALRLRHYGHPYGRNADGETDAVNQITLKEIKNYYQNHYHPQSAIIGVAGNVDWEPLKDLIGQLFADWQPQPVNEPVEAGAQHGYHHIPFESNQTHISIGWPGLAYRDEDYYLLRGAIGVLSDGMSSRLFREVREQRGLCYTVSASCHSIHDRGAIFGYAGTTTQSSQETLNVMLEQIELLAQGVTEKELDRLKVQFRSGLIMQQESCRSRVSTITGDIFHLGRVRTLDEVNERINSLTPAQINRYLENNPPGPFDIVTLGEQPLEVNGAIPTTSAR
ncbi:MAG: pitrilysin family protein [Pirellulaceae bacterium]